MKKLLSYLIPVTEYETQSNQGKTLKVCWWKGKLILDSEKANYSFGELHRVFQIAFNKIGIKNYQIQNVLILGYGTGSVASILIDELELECSITGIEKDAGVLQIGKKYFSNWFNHPLINVTEGNAADLTNLPSNSFDLIVMDVYDDIEVPFALETENHLNEVKRILKENGLYIFNKVLATTEQKNRFKSFRLIFEKVFHLQQVVNVRGINDVLVGRKN